jgi:hypothetical protein
MAGLRTRRFSAVGDRLLRAVLGEVEAGACVPENGHFCLCYDPSGYACKLVYACDGQCYNQCCLCC